MAKSKHWLVMYNEKKDEFVAMENKKFWQIAPKTIGGMKVVGDPFAGSAVEAIDWIKGCQR